MIQVMTIENRLIKENDTRFGKRLETTEEFDRRVNQRLKDLDDNDYKVKDIKITFTYVDDEHDSYLNKVATIIYEME